MKKLRVTPLVFSTLGGMGKEARTFYRHLADAKIGEPYPLVMNWIRCQLCFSIFCSCIMCLRGSRSSFGHFINEPNLGFLLQELMNNYLTLLNLIYVLFCLIFALFLLYETSLLSKAPRP